MKDTTSLKLPVRTVLINSGRFDEICIILSNIIRDRQSDYPVSTTIDAKTGNVIRRVKAEDVVKGIAKWYELIYTTGEHTPVEDYRKLEALSFLIHSRMDMKLHNYAVVCSHRKEVTDEELEEIRAYEVLNSTLDHFMYDMRDYYTGEFLGFEVPEGWCKVA